MTKRKSFQIEYLTNSVDCLVCGDISRGVNFGLLTCMPCKSFFRKNVFNKSNITCSFDNHCSITKLTRSFCTACRLNKCLKLGMDPDLIRKIPISRQFRLKSCIINDCLKLSSNEWMLLSYLIRCYDERNSCQRIKYYLNEISSLPIKLRIRTNNTYNLLLEFMMSVQLLIEKIPEFYSLSSNIRRIVVKHNLYCIGSFHGMFLCRELNLCQNINFMNIFLNIYGEKLLIEFTRICLRYDCNGTLIKLIMIIMAFSSNCSIVNYNENEFLLNTENSLCLIRIQNAYVEILWKYLINLYDFKQAVCRYSFMIKNFLDIIQLLLLIKENENHNRMIETIERDIEHTLLIRK